MGNTPNVVSCMNKQRKGPRRSFNRRLSDKSDSKYCKDGLKGMNRIICKSQSGSMFNSEVPASFGATASTKDFKMNNNDENVLNNELNESGDIETTEKINRLIAHKNIRKMFEFQKILGRGAHGVVHQAMDRKYQSTAKAIKTVLKEKVGFTFMNDASILSSLDHPNIMRLFDMYEDSTQYHMVNEFCEGGDLASFINNQSKPLDERKASKIIYQLLLALNYMHQKGLAHRDIKAENVLFASKDQSEDLCIKLCDFGFATKLKKHSETGEQIKLCKVVGSPFYIAPEVLNRSYDERSDIWSTGVLLYFILSKTFPFQGSSQEEIFENIRKGKVQFEPSIWKNVSEKAIDLIRKMLVKSPVIRLNAKEALDHPWFQGIRYGESIKLTDQITQRIVTNMSKNNDFKKIVMIAASRFLYNHQIQDFNRIFDKVDKDHKGCFTKEELMKAIFYASPGIDTQEISIQFYNYDLFFKEHFTYSEFIALCIDQQKMIPKETLWVTFRYLSDQETGKITLQSLEKNVELIFNLYGPEISQKLQQMISKVTKNEKGISFCEFMDYMSNKQS